MITEPYVLSAEEREAIDDAARKLNYVETQPDGTYRIEMYADYTDTNEFLLQPAYKLRDCAIKTPHPEEDLLFELQVCIHEAYYETIEDAAYEILDAAGFDPRRCDSERDEAAVDYLRENYDFVPPYDHYLDQTVRVNIMLRTPEDQDQSDNLIHYQYLAMARPDELSDSSPEAIAELLNQDSYLKRLVEQQGHTMAELSETVGAYMRDFYDPDGHPAQYCDENGKSLPYETRVDLFTAGRSRFLVSLCEELDNQTYSWGCVTVLAEVSMKAFAEMMKPGAEISMPCDAHVGIFAPWNGSGSILGVELAKNLVFTREDIYDIQIEGAEPDFGCSVDHDYGLTRGCWKEPVSIKVPDPERKNALNDIISDAAVRAGTQGQSSPVREDLSH